MNTFTNHWIFSGFVLSFTKKKKKYWIRYEESGKIEENETVFAWNLISMWKHERRDSHWGFELVLHEGSEMTYSDKILMNISYRFQVILYKQTLRERAWNVFKISSFFLLLRYSSTVIKIYTHANNRSCQSVTSLAAFRIADEFRCSFSAAQT